MTQVPLSSLADEMLLVHRREARRHLDGRLEQGPCEVHVVLSSVRACRGVAVVPSSARLLRRPGVVLKPLAGQALRPDLAIAWRRGEALAAVQQLGRALVAVSP